MKRLFSFLFFLSLVAILLFAITCKKEYSYEGGAVAKYSFVGSPDTCTSALVSGDYIKNTPTDSSNNLVVYVIVTAPGSAEITTETIDGIFFTTGKINLIKSSPLNYGILLYCHGSPTEAGVFTFHIPGTTGCSFSITVNGKQSANIILSGSPNDCTNPVHQGSFKQGVAATSSNLITVNIDVIEKGDYNITTDTVNGFYFSGSGTFSSTGTRQVVLQAYGTPNASELSRFTVTAGASQCSFYVAVDNADPLATYVLQSAQGNGVLYCAPGSVQGSYTAGTTLNGSNTLTVNAYVTVPGNYTISTTEINGVRFSATGTFTNTGAQDVVLKGSGTPVDVGTFTFVPQIVGPAPLGGSSCGLDVDVK